MKKELIIYLVQKDFRLTDNIALNKAISFSQERNIPIIPIFCLDSKLIKSLGNFQKYYLAKVLAHFSFLFPNLPIFLDSCETVFEKLSAKFNLTIFINQNLNTFYREQTNCLNNKYNVQCFFDRLSINSKLRTKIGNIYSVFTPFKKAAWEEFINLKPIKKIEISIFKFEKEIYQEFNKLGLNRLSYHQTQENLENNLLERLQVISTSLINFIYVNEENSQKKLENFCLQNIFNYENSRNDMSNPHGISKLSLDLSWGLISVRQIINFIYSNLDINNLSVQTFISELIWREFYGYLYFHYPELNNQEFLEKRRQIPWITGDLAEQRFHSWKQGKTGYPLVDAGMNEINQTGFMHNRTRMVVGSFLTKHLGINWRWGQDYFANMLLDFDEPSNNGGWQWSASVGADPKPVRIFNPTIQALKYDAKSLYQKRWIDFSAYDTSQIVEHKESVLLAKLRYGI